jgi:coenzyme PQQ precursor peptide PqqA
MIKLSPSLNLPRRKTKEQDIAAEVPNGGNTMAWTAPVIVEVCVGMEVTSYSSAEI